MNTSACVMLMKWSCCWTLNELQMSLYPDNGVITDSGIDLGITQNDISFASDSSHNYFAFEQSGELWSYDVQSGKMAQIFTFRQKGDSDYRDFMENMISEF